MRQIRALVYKKDRLKDLAVDYFETWGNKFWLTTEERMLELTEKVESKLSGALSGTKFGVKANLEGAKALSTEQKKEVIQRGQKAVSEVQIRELENMLTVLADDIFNDPQEHYYLTIDTLDEDWADDRIKYSLIKSLMDTVRKFRRINNVKVIIALRQDLLDKVLHTTHDSGFQEEKYESLYLEIKWKPKALVDIVDKRIQNLVKRRYTKQAVTYNDIFTSEVDGVNPLEYIISRTFKRPRDIILYVNECINNAEDDCHITAKNIKTSEEEYSYKRLKSLATEWLIKYPYLSNTLNIFYAMNSKFEVSELDENMLSEKFSEAVSDIKDIENDQLLSLLNRYFSGSSGNFNTLRNSFLRELFYIGFLGIKAGSSSSIQWSTDTRLSIAPGQLKASSKIFIHPMFYRALDINIKGHH